MAKKVKKKIEEDDQYKAFSFPEFDVRGFIHHELEQTSATAFAIFLSIGVALVSWYLTSYGEAINLTTSLAVVSAVIGIIGAVVLPLLIRFFREKAGEYRTGDWATLIAIYVFLWLGLWSLLLNFGTA